MKVSKLWRWLSRKLFFVFDQGMIGAKMKQMQFLGVVCTLMLFLLYRLANYQHQRTEMESKLNPYIRFKDLNVVSTSFNSLPRGIIEARSDLELKPLWSADVSKPKVNIPSSHNLLAIAVGVKQKQIVDAIAEKFLSENFTIILFHYDENMDGWLDLEWARKAVHIVAHNQTKWWFAKRFLHPSVVSIYDYIFLWDEDLGVQNFNPRRYLEIVKLEGLEISQPALDPHSTGIHHRITIRKRTKKFHRRIYDARGRSKCSDDSDSPPCTGFVEGMAPVFSRSAWHCVWHLIQNDLIHGWGMDMKLGYCAKGDRTKKVGIVDSEYIVHRGIQTLGGLSARKVSDRGNRIKGLTIDARSEIRRQSTRELERFKKRWDDAVQEDSQWVDPFHSSRHSLSKKGHHRKI